MLMTHVEVLRTGNARGNMECACFQDLQDYGYLDKEGERTEAGNRLLGEVQTILRTIDISNGRKHNEQ